MREMGIRGVTRGKKVKTTLPATADVIPLDRVNREFTVSAPNRLWVADLSYVATWRGFVYVAFVIDAFARRIVGWRVSSSLRADIALEALEQALYDRRIAEESDLAHHIATAVGNSSRSLTRRVYPKPASSLRSTASAIPMTMRWPKRSSACTTPN